MTRVGVISDTHGLLRPEAGELLADADLIIHAGDVGKPHVLEALRAIAPLIAVRGNVDRDAWADQLPRVASTSVDGHKLYVLHNLAELDVDPVAAGIAVVISGHSHKAKLQRRDDGVTLLNPGSAGPRRFKLPISLATMHIEGSKIDIQIHEIEV